MLNNVLLHNVLLWLHIGFAIFAIGPLTIATMTTPRYIRAREEGVVRFLHRTTRLYGWISVVVFLAGAAMAGTGRGFDETWLSVSMLLFVIGLIMILGIVEPDQRKAVRMLQGDGQAAVGTSRIAAVSGVVSLLWIAILVLMIWQP